MKPEKKTAYSKPAVLAVTKNKLIFSAGCASKTGMMCIMCRCK